MRIGPRCNAKCANIVSLSGQCVSRGLLNCGISVSFLRVPEYLHAQLIQRSVLSIALLMLYLAKWEELRLKKRFGANQDQMHSSVDVRNGGMPTQKAIY